MPQTKTLGQQAAMASWLTPIVVLIASQFVRNTGNQAAPAYMGFVRFILIGFGFVFSILALRRLGQDGRKGILIPGIIGLVLNGLMLALYTLFQSRP